MQNSDDYFSDDFELNEDALAVLDGEEQKYTLSVIQSAPPPTKRQRTENGWKPGQSNYRSELDDLEDLPEISVQGDGTYGIEQATPSVQPPNCQWKQDMRVADSRDSSSPSVRDDHTISSGPRNPASSVSWQGQPVKPPPSQRQISGTGSDLLSSGQASSRAQTVVPRVSTSILHEKNGAEIEALRRQMKELQNENSKIQSDLREAMDVRFMKEGEVSILRKSMEKTAQDHAAQVTKLKVAREGSDAKQVQIQKEMKEEMERLRTQFTFKQHELETSARKPTWSTASNKISKEPPPTPVQIPSQIRGWNLPDANGATSSRVCSQTPRRQVGSTVVSETPRTNNGRNQPFFDSAKKPAILPGFQNSFIPTSPVMTTQSRRKEKGTGRRTRADMYGNYGPGLNGPFAPSPPSSPIRGKQDVTSRDDVQMEDEFGPAGDEPTSGGLGLGDIEMDGSEPGSQLVEEIEEVEVINQREDFHQLIFTHTSPPSMSSTFQDLMRIRLPDTLTLSSIETYHAAATRVLGILASTSADITVTIGTVSNALTHMASILNSVNLISPLIALLNLMTHLTCSFSAFGSSLLSNSQDNESSTSHQPLIVTVLTDIVRCHLVPSREPAGVHLTDDRKALAEDTIGLLELLCWNTPKHLQERLASIPRTLGVLGTLLNPLQPSWFLARSTRLLVFLASHPILFRDLLSFPDVENGSNDTDKDFSNLPHLELLCSHLIDSVRSGDEAMSLKDSILMFVSMLSISHEDAITILLESQTLIPSLVIYLTQSMIPLWEDDEAVVSSVSQQSYSIRTAYQALLLFHRLVFGTEPIYNLRQKLNQASQIPQSSFNGVVHMFIVTFGRLSYADVPEWVHHQAKDELEQMAVMAIELLDLVVEGPEGDSVYAAFQGGDESATDDEEMEARHLHPNVDDDS